MMLRNLPIRWTAADLKKALDKALTGKYDFSYLRIDFEWNIIGKCSALFSSFASNKSLTRIMHTSAIQHYPALPHGRI